MPETFGSTSKVEHPPLKLWSSDVNEIRSSVSPSSPMVNKAVSNTGIMIKKPKMSMWRVLGYVWKNYPYLGDYNPFLI